ncbi:hypothetical protein [Azospirillum sp. B4]|uniref:hypothetical protein n=1 Tax=Azospirillum sp. B4 TaxID=95605 RepID=UPI00034AFA37|nr:hypothetical protein [Azospirillum sp. B4]
MACLQSATGRHMKSWRSGVIAGLAALAAEVLGGGTVLDAPVPHTQGDRRYR